MRRESILIRLLPAPLLIPVRRTKVRHHDRDRRTTTRAATPLAGGRNLTDVGQFVARAAAAAAPTTRTAGAGEEKLGGGSGVDMGAGVGLPRGHGIVGATAAGAFETVVIMLSGKIGVNTAMKKYRCEKKKKKTAGVHVEVDCLRLWTLILSYRRYKERRCRMYHRWLLLWSRQVSRQGGQGRLCLCFLRWGLLRRDSPLSSGWLGQGSLLPWGWLQLTLLGLGSIWEPCSPCCEGLLANTGSNLSGQTN